jgi:hypothetical protein
MEKEIGYKSFREFIKTCRKFGKERENVISVGDFQKFPVFDLGEKGESGVG